MKKRLEDAREDLKETVSLFETLEVPGLTRETEYLSLRAIDCDEYPFYDGWLVSTRDPMPTASSEYKRRVIESVVSHSTAKHCRSPRSKSYAVGALARFKNNFDRLHPEASEVARRLGLTASSCNPFHNNTAQLVETVHCVEAAIESADELLTRGLIEEQRVPPRSFGRGVGAVEAPRGMLFHEYTLDNKGRVSDANLIIPTGQNLANIEDDMRVSVKDMVERGASREEITLRLEMLIRAYDPCISCATHFLELEWV